MANIEVKIIPAESPPNVEDGDDDDDEEGDEVADDSSSHSCNIQSLFALDDFDQFSARASSGGSLYGVLRKQALLQAIDNEKSKNSSSALPQEIFKRSNFLCPPGLVYHHRHNRSKSLVHRKATLADDKSILKFLYDYSENLKAGVVQPVAQNRRSVQEIRRHSEAAMNCRLFIQAGDLTPEMINEVTTKLKSEGAALQQNHRRDCESKSQSHSNNENTSSSVPKSKFVKQRPGVCQTRHQSITPPSSSSPRQPVPPGVSVCRRRSFSIRQNEVRNEGDEMLVVPLTLVAENQDSEINESTSIPSVHGSGRNSDRRDSSRSWQQSSIRRRCSSNVNDSQAVQSSPVVVKETGEINYATDSAEEAVGGSGAIQNLYKVLMLGGPGVGKTALTQQFLTSEFMAAQNTSFDDCVQVTVPVLLDGDSIFVEFIDLPYNGDTYQWKDFNDVNGYVIVYSIIDRRSFNKAMHILDQIRCTPSSANKPVILVANKNDLERSRLIAKQEGRSAAESRDCKYIDVSAILNHKVDDLLVGILKQMRDCRNFQTHKNSIGDSDACFSSDKYFRKPSGDCLAEKMTGCFSTNSKHSQKPENLWAKLIRKKSWKRILSKSCENLL